jgi:predicted transcriptional regulator
VNRNELAELLEGEAAKLSPEGKELWKEMEVLVELNPEDGDTLSQQAEINNRTAILPSHERHALERLTELRAGLYNSDNVEEQGESGERHRVQAALIAAGLKDVSEGRLADPEMTIGQALARLRQ